MESLHPHLHYANKLAANAQKRLDIASKTRQETDEKVTKASRGWAQLISRHLRSRPINLCKLRQENKDNHLCNTSRAYKTYP